MHPEKCLRFIWVKWQTLILFDLYEIFLFSKDFFYATFELFAHVQVHTGTSVHACCLRNAHPQLARTNRTGSTVLLNSDSIYI